MTIGQSIGLEVDVDDIVTIGQSIGLEVDVDDIEELLEDHGNKLTYRRTRTPSK